MAASGTALITGASSGIGAVYADRLAQRGYDLILVARDTSRLAALAAQLEQATGCRVETLSADLTERAQLARVEQRLATDPAIAMLVNNAGMSLHGTWLSCEAAELEQMIALNTVAPTLLARAAANAFAARGGGAIVNIASVLALTPEAFDGAYSGTKAHLLNLSLSIQAKLADSGIYCQAVLPCATRTEIFERSGKDIATFPPEWVMEPEHLVDAALRGFDRRETVTIPSLADEAEWAALHAARLAIAPSLQHGQVAARYR